MNSKTLQNVLNAFAGKCVLIVGDVMLDEYIWGNVRRISPEAPVPIVEIQRRTYFLGGAGNTAANVISLSGRALLGGTIGDDLQAITLCEALQEQGIKAKLLKDPARPTTTKTRVIAHSQQVVRVDHEKQYPLYPEMEETLLNWVKAHLEEANVFLLSDYAKGVVTSRLAKQTIQLAQRAHKPIIVDPKGNDYRKYQGATVVAPNIQEARLALNRLLDPAEDLLELGRELLTLLDGSTIFITQGSEGMSLFRSGEKVMHIPAVTRYVYDVTGAGDTVVATLALALAAGATLEEAAHLANVAASIVVGKVGTAAATPEELKRELS